MIAIANGSPESGGNAERSRLVHLGIIKTCGMLMEVRGQSKALS